MLDPWTYFCAKAWRAVVYVECNAFPRFVALYWRIREISVIL